VEVWGSGRGGAGMGPKGGVWSIRFSICNTAGQGDNDCGVGLLELCCSCTGVLLRLPLREPFCEPGVPAPPLMLVTFLPLGSD